MYSYSLNLNMHYMCLYASLFTFVFNCLFLIQEGTTPLVLAAANNHLDCVRELLKQGADPAARRLVSIQYSLVLFLK